jgi:hypothetical protein
MGQEYGRDESGVLTVHATFVGQFDQPTDCLLHFFERGLGGPLCPYRRHLAGSENQLVRHLRRLDAWIEFRFHAVSPSAILSALLSLANADWRASARMSPMA